MKRPRPSNVAMQLREAETMGFVARRRRNPLPLMESPSQRYAIPAQTRDIAVAAASNAAQFPMVFRTEIGQAMPLSPVTATQRAAVGYGAARRATMLRRVGRLNPLAIVEGYGGRVVQNPSRSDDLARNVLELLG